MRDIAVTLAVFATIPFILRRPYVGILVWSWLGYMNPHRLAWGFATEMPFAQIVAIATFLGMLLDKSGESKRVPWTRETVLLLIFTLWMFVTTIFALYPAASWEQWDKVWKIILMTFVTLMLIKSKERLNLLLWVIVLSLGFYGVKGGIWVLGTGGVHRVMGPEGSFIGGNNELGLALIMIIPLMRYVQVTVQNVWIRHGMTAAMILTFVAVLGTHSRGALLGVAAMGVLLLLKSRKKFLPLLLAATLIPLVPIIMPEHWFERMHTIETYEEDRSAQGRLAAWREAVEIADRRPILGGGFEALLGGTDAHSIYFEILCEHGYVGLALWLVLGLFTWRSATWIIRKSKGVEELRWARDLASMLQVSAMGYGVAGAFLGLAYFDLIYHLVVIVVLTKLLVKQHVEAESRKAVKAADQSMDTVREHSGAKHRVVP